MKILLVAPGEMKVPTDGWGAIETIVWEMSSHLKNQGHEIKILNSKNRFKHFSHYIIYNYDFVHIHYDEFVPLWLKFKRYLPIVQSKIFLTSHSPTFLATLSNPNPLLIYNLRKLSGVITLTESQKFALESLQIRASALGNGIDVNKYRFYKETNKRVLLLGKIEERKRQALVAQLESFSGLPIDFVGPFHETLKLSSKNHRVLGSWNRTEVVQNIGRYSALLIASECEGFPLVSLEALAAGVPVIGTFESIPEELRNINGVISTDFNSLPQQIVSILSKNIDVDQRKIMKERLSEMYSWDSLIKKYEEILNNA